MITIVDYDTGNTKSISQAFEKIGQPTIISSDPQKIIGATGLILPGVGAFPKAMEALKEAGLIEPIKEAVAKGVPLLGICLGMQLLFETSVEYGETKGLGLIPGKVIPIPEMKSLLIPHMGWNQLEMTKRSQLFAEVEGEYVYYVHSYYVDCPKEYLIATSDYGIKVPGIVAKDNLFGTQFHPEKSGEAGQKILKQFKKVVEAYDSISSH